MKHHVDFIYEYSDLNPLFTRVKILTGQYAGMVLEYGGSVLHQWEDKNEFRFEYILYEVPEPYDCATLRKDAAFNEFIGLLLVDVITARREDPNERLNIREAAADRGIQNSIIPINIGFYEDKGVNRNKYKQPQTDLGAF